MKQLVVHMKDLTTEFLCEIYEDIPNITVIRQFIDIRSMNKLIEEHDRVIMLGHGSPQGLFSNHGGFIIDENNVKALKKKQNIYIWCHASMFVHEYKLKGFSTGMFVSEVLEANWCDVPLRADSLSEVSESNRAFARLVRSQIENPVEVIYEHCYTRYTPEKYNKSKVVEYNHCRLQLID